MTTPYYTEIGFKNSSIVVHVQDPYHNRLLKIMYFLQFSQAAVSAFTYGNAKVLDKYKY